MPIAYLKIILLGLGLASFPAHAQENPLEPPAELEPLSDAPDTSEGQQSEKQAESGEGREELGDIWNSTDVFGGGGLLGTDITRQVIVEQILEPEGDYRYAAFGKPDPFLPPFDVLAGLAQTSTATGVEPVLTPRTVTGEEIAIISPLQTELSNLTVIGMWQLDDGTRKALVSNGASQAVVVEVGDPIGYTGRVAEIRPEGVITRQYSLRSDGSREYEDVLLLFGDKEDVLKEQIGQRVMLSPGGGATVKEVGPRINEPKTSGKPNIEQPANARPEAEAVGDGVDPKVPQIINEGVNANRAQNQNPGRRVNAGTGGPVQNPGVQQPNSIYQQPNPGYAQPNVSLQQPNSGFQQPGIQQQGQPSGGTAQPYVPVQQ